MHSQVPDALKEEQKALEEEIRRAFRGVRRGRGVSWSESNAIDNYEKEAERERARALDIERSWEDLVDDPDWRDENSGRFTFLDALGWTYYVAPAMVRATRRGFGEAVAWALTVADDLRREKARLLDAGHVKAIRRFISFMTAVEEANDTGFGDRWDAAAESWQSWEKWSDWA
jgi:hypothetical protein